MCLPVRVNPLLDGAEGELGGFELVWEQEACR